MNGIRLKGSKVISKVEAEFIKITDEDLLEMHKRHAAQAAASLIMDKDGVITVTSDKDSIHYDFDVYIMTPKELDDYVKAEIEKAASGSI